MEEKRHHPLQFNLDQEFDELSKLGGVERLETDPLSLNAFDRLLDERGDDDEELVDESPRIPVQVQDAQRSQAPEEEAGPRAVEPEPLHGPVQSSSILTQDDALEDLQVQPLLPMMRKRSLEALSEAVNADLGTLGLHPAVTPSSPSLTLDWTKRACQRYVENSRSCWLSEAGRQSRLRWKVTGYEPKT